MSATPSTSFRPVLEATKTYEAPAAATGGAELVIEVRRIPISAFEDIRAKSDQGSWQDKETARLGLVAPRCRFDKDESGDEPLWEDLPLALRLFIAGSVMEFTTEGVVEVTQALRPFRGEGEGGNPSGSPGPIRNPDLNDGDETLGSSPGGSGTDVPVGEIPL